MRRHPLEHPVDSATRQTRETLSCVGPLWLLPGYLPALDTARTWNSLMRCGRSAEILLISATMSMSTPLNRLQGRWGAGSRGRGVGFANARAATRAQASCGTRSALRRPQLAHLLSVMASALPKKKASRMSWCAGGGGADVSPWPSVAALRAPSAASHAVGSGPWWPLSLALAPEAACGGGERGIRVCGAHGRRGCRVQRLCRKCTP